MIEEHGAFRGYVVSTSGFTVEAIESAGLSEKVALVDMDVLVGWHASAPTFWGGGDKSCTGCC